MVAQDRSVNELPVFKDAAAFEEQQNLIAQLGAVGITQHYQEAVAADLETTTVASDLATSKTLAKALADALSAHALLTTKHSAASTVDNSAHTSSPSVPANLAEVIAVANELKADLLGHLQNGTPHRAAALVAGQDGIDTFVFGKEADDGAAATDTVETGIWVAPYDCYIKSAKYLPGAVLTAHDTNYATLTLSQRDGAGGGAAIVAEQTTKITGGSGDWVAFVAEPLTLSGTIANLFLAAGEVLTFKIIKSGSGVAVGLGALILEFGHSLAMTLGAVSVPDAKDQATANTLLNACQVALNLHINSGAQVVVTQTS
jgi:hypothetical protein